MMEGNIWPQGDGRARSERRWSRAFYEVVRKLGIERKLV